MKICMLLVICAFGTVGCALTTVDTSDEALAHVVLIWLKDAGDVQARQHVITASKRLADIDGVLRLDVGQSIASKRGAVDDSFDVGLYIEFSSPDALARYVEDPEHVRIVQQVLAPLIDHYIAYDFEIRRDQN